MASSWACVGAANFQRAALESVAARSLPGSPVMPRLERKKARNLAVSGPVVFRCFWCGYVAASSPGSGVCGCSSGLGYQHDKPKTDCAAARPRFVLEVLLVLERIVFMVGRGCIVGLSFAMRRTVKSLYADVNTNENIAMTSLQEEHTKPNTTVTRRRRLQLLLQTFFQEQAAQGVPPKGLEQTFAAKLQISPSLLSQIKKARPIGDKLARQIETMCEVPSGWLDREVEELEGADPAEEAFLALARQAWRSANARDKRAITRLISVSPEQRAKAIKGL
jgi:hypothetical protein